MVRRGRETKRIDRIRRTRRVDWAQAKPVSVVLGAVERSSQRPWLLQKDSFQNVCVSQTTRYDYRARNIPPRYFSSIFAGFEVITKGDSIRSRRYQPPDSTVETR